MKKILLCMCLIGMFCIPKIYAGYGTGNDVSGSSVAVSNFYQVIPHIVDVSTNIVNAADRIVVNNSTATETAADRITINNSTNTSRSNELIVNISTNIERTDILIVDISSNVQNLKETNKTFLVDIATNTQKVDADINKLNQDVTVNASTNTALVYNELKTKFYNPNSTMTIVNPSMPLNPGNTVYIVNPEMPLNSGNTIYMVNPNIPLNPGNTVYITNTEFVAYVNTVTFNNTNIDVSNSKIFVDTVSVNELGTLYKQGQLIGNTTFSIEGKIMIDTITINNTGFDVTNRPEVFVNTVTVVNFTSTVTIANDNLNVTATNFTSSVTLTNPSLIEFDVLNSSVTKIMANESNGIVSFSPIMSVKSISILSEGGYNSVTTNNCGYYNDIPDGMPDNIILPRVVINPTFSWSLTAGTTLHIQVVGGK
ncbi:MAG: hypothetical protein PHX21_13755 [bacterium]|nr:hypothetical protein [bacterium]